ncbi:MAG: hypothetical protein IKO61_05875 [Lachnospiraceae bacterium]|nr:hypothetical protein [Lachnospiraceae bacterium]
MPEKLNLKRKKALYGFVTYFLAFVLFVGGFGSIRAKADETEGAVSVRSFSEDGAGQTTGADESAGGQAEDEYELGTAKFAFAAEELGNQIKIATTPLEEVNGYFDWRGYEGRYIYDRLDADEKELYDELVASSQKLITTTVACKQSKVSVSGVTRQVYYPELCYSSKLTLERAKDVAWMFIWQNPQYYFYNNNLYFGQNNTTGKVYVAVGVYSDFADGEARAEATVKFAEALKEKEEYLEGRLLDVSDTYKREVLIHDAVCEWLDYRSVSYDQSAYSALCGNPAGAAICAGYTKLFDMLLTRFNIPVIGVFSYDHCWSIVNIYGDWYNVDVTWDDEKVTKDYLNRNDAFFKTLSSHTARSYYNGALPECPYDYSTTNTKSEEMTGDAAEGITVSYRVQLQSFGWLPKAQNGQTGGVVKSGKKLQGYSIEVNGAEKLGIRYRSYITDYGWEEWINDGEKSGQSLNKRIEALMVELTGKNAVNYDVYYRVYVQKNGWMGWAKNGAKAGTIGQNLRIEAIQIIVVPKGEHPMEGTIGVPYMELAGTDDELDDVANSAASVYYRAYVQGVGYQRYVGDGSIGGLPGAGKRIEGLNIKVNNAQLGLSGGIKYRTYVQTHGWLKWVTSSGNTVAYSGTKGEAKRIEAIQINLTGALASEYDVYYRVNVQDYGWLDWTKNGATAGTSGLAKRMEGIQITIVPKGTPAPGSTAKSFIKKTLSP